jgi:Cd2+/Zn2+-exporting ATPase
MEHSASDVLKFAAALEVASSHPFAIAIFTKAADEKIEVSHTTDAKAIGGKGVTATVDGVDLFLGSPQAAGERVPLSGEQAAQVSSLNDEGKTVSILLAGKAS